MISRNYVLVGQRNKRMIYYCKYGQKNLGNVTLKMEILHYRVLFPIPRTSSAVSIKVGLRVSSKRKKEFSVRTETNRNKICFGFCFGLFRETKEKLFRFVSVCFGVSNLYRNNRNKQNCFKTNRNKLNFSSIYRSCISSRNQNPGKFTHRSS